MSTISRGPIDLRVVVSNKSPGLSRRIPDTFLKAFGRLLHIRELNQGLRSLAHTSGLEFVHGALAYFGVHTAVTGLQHLDGVDRPVVVANHPLGGLDGLAILQAVGRVKGDLASPVNEFLLAIPQLRTLFLPVHKLGVGKTALAPLLDVYRSDKTIVTFPAGLCSRLRGGRIRDLTWQKSFVALARKYDRPIVPAYIDGRNSMRFYVLAKIRAALGISFNLEMMFLVDEMYRQKGQTLSIAFGAPIDSAALERGRDWEHARRLRAHVYRLASGERAGERAGERV